jgi:hypothetical protein
MGALLHSVWPLFKNNSTVRRKAINNIMRQRELLSIQLDQLFEQYGDFLAFFCRLFLLLLVERARMRQNALQKLKKMDGALSWVVCMLDTSGLWVLVLAIRISFVTVTFFKPSVQHHTTTRLVPCSRVVEPFKLLLGVGCSCSTYVYNT